MSANLVNKLTFNGDPQFTKIILKFIQYDPADVTDLVDTSHTIDFNKIITMPANIYRGELTLKDRPENNWYDWSIANWNTKFNSYYDKTLLSRATEDTIYFYTSWNPATPVILALSIMCPQLQLDYSWASQDTGQIIGQVLIQNGVIIKELV